MDHGKYIIVVVRGHRVAILFNVLIEHDLFLDCFDKHLIISAGFFKVEITSKVVEKVLVTQDLVVETFGISTTLNLRSKDSDAILIKKVLTDQKG